MAIASGDILWMYSTKDGSSGFSEPGTATGSLGKYISQTEWSGGTLHDLFDKITGTENQNSDVEYRCIFVANDHDSLTYQSPVVWIYDEVAGGADIAIAIDDLEDSPTGQASAQADEIADEDTAPTAVSAFSSPTTEGNALSLGDIAAGNCRAIWVRRTANNTSAQSNDGVTLRVRGDTEA